MAGSGTSGRRDKTSKNRPEDVGLPGRFFLYTLDQIAQILSLEVKTIKASYIFYDGVDVGIVPRDRLIARNIAPAGQTPEWRVAENELVRWMKLKGFRYIDRGYIGW